MNTTKAKPAVEKITQQEHAHPDANGFIQNHPDARGFAPGKELPESDEMWHSQCADAHGWHHSSTK